MSSAIPGEWRPSASLEVLVQRAKLLHEIRGFFSRKCYLEVETPIMGSFGVTDVHLNNITATFKNQTYYLQTSPEYHMKRLLAAGSGPIFQLFRAFRNDEVGRLHNPEFTLLEWYQLDIDHHGLIKEVGEFLQAMLACESLVSMSYEDAFLQACKLNPFDTSIRQLSQKLSEFELDNVLGEGERDKDQYLYLLMSHVVEPWLSQLNYPVAIYDFPPSQAALAKISGDRAERFEVYYQGIELANGFHELTESDIQEARFKEDNQKRRALGYKKQAIDHRLLDALKHGLPNCSGVALGVDRLFALLLSQNLITSAMAFNISHA